ncbi:MAG: zf-HC2 domain-containing protein [Gemmatimonadota bacterium]
MHHPTDDRFEAYVEGRLEDADRASLESHVVACSRCQGQLEEWRALFTALRTLPRLAPSADFGNAVMARVRIARPWHAAALGRLQRWVPDSTRGWAAAVALLALPVVLGSGVMAWLLSRSYVTASGLWVFAEDVFATGANRLASQTSSAVLQSSLVTRLLATAEGFYANAGVQGIGLVATVALLSTTLSIWVLYRNLYRTPQRETNHASYCF